MIYPLSEVQFFIILTLAMIFILLYIFWCRRKWPELNDLGIIATSVISFYGSYDLLKYVWFADKDITVLRAVWLTIVSMGLFIASFKLLWTSIISDKSQHRVE